MLVGEAGDDAALEAADAQHAAPVAPVDPHRRPPVRAGLAEPRARVLGQRHRQLRRVQLRVLQPPPLRPYVQRLRPQPQPQRPVHVGRQRQLRTRPRPAAQRRRRRRRRAAQCRRPRPGPHAQAAAAAAAAAAGQGELGEAVRYRLELQQRRQLDVHVRLPHLGLHDGLDRVRVQHPHRYVLRDDLLALALHGQLERLLREDVLVVLVAAVAARRVVGVVGMAAKAAVAVVVVIVTPARVRDAAAAAAAASASSSAAVLGHGVDGQRQHRDAVPLGQAHVGIAAADGRLEGALQRGERQLEVDGVVGLGRLDVVVVEDQVNRERAAERPPGRWCVVCLLVN